MTTVTNVHPNSMLRVWVHHSYNEQSGTFNSYWYVGHLEGDGYNYREEVSRKVSMQDGAKAQVTLEGSESESQNHKSIIVPNTSESWRLT
jgi:hypothetical protein